jgi:pimeloyl-ACP methyl ester carboxylesterase
MTDPQDRDPEGRITTEVREHLLLIGIDRPGYGLSTPKSGRRLADWADDIAEFADRMRLSRFGVIGLSGGAPYGAMVAHALSDRVNALALGLDVIAEGIEYPEQADTVFAAGCRMAQGHLFGRAVPLTELGRVLAATREEAVPRP